jgi:chemotaxis protein MotB
MALNRNRRRSIDIWPGFVDALATVLMVMLFVLMVFVLAQFFLSHALTGSEQANLNLSRQLTALADQLSLTKQANSELLDDLTIAKTEAASASAEKLTLDEKVAVLSEQLSKIAQALSLSETQVSSQKLQIDDLGEKLNKALTSQIEELRRYRSEFFGRLRQLLGNRPGIRIEGDRFVFQSELLFATGSAQLGEDGLAQVHQIAASLRQLNTEIPKNIKWVLRVDGHTDKRPISGKYRSNWELSTARAMTVIRTLIADGIPADHLAAAGFGEFQPLDPGDSEGAYSRNRRIELRLDQL